MRSQNLLLRILTGPERKLRFIWRAAIFWVIGEYGLPALVTPLVRRNGRVARCRRLAHGTKLGALGILPIRDCFDRHSRILIV
jgi:hypothetical protein